VFLKLVRNAEQEMQGLGECGEPGMTALVRNGKQRMKGIGGNGGI
jgi:hypothetical protein